MIHSMQVVSDSFSREEIGQAKSVGLLDDQQALELVQGKL